MKNKLIRGDCINVLAEMEAGIVDLAYIDPPYCTGTKFSDFSDDFRNYDRRKLEEAWQLCTDFNLIDEKTNDFIRCQLTSETDLANYLTFMYYRLLFIQRSLKPTGSLYVHVDAIASHYLKVILDRMFGYKAFRREIICETMPAGGFKGMAENWIRRHDVILYYVCDPNHFTYNKQYQPLTESSIRRYNKTDSDGRKYMDKKNKDGSRYRCYLNVERGVPVSDVILWHDIPHHSVKPESDEERYDTQKSVKLLELIIKTSTNVGDVVMDCFCGSGTTLVAANNLGRNYIGIDANQRAIDMATSRLSLGALFE